MSADTVTSPFGQTQTLANWVGDQVNVRDFGAVCDNQSPTQDTAAFQAAFDWVAHTNGYTIRVPSGQCRINKTIHENFSANSGIHLVGAGKEDTQITFEQPAGAADYNGFEITVSGYGSRARSSNCCGTDGEFIDIENMSVISNPAVPHPIGTAFVLQGNFALGNTGDLTTFMRHVLITNSGNINNSTTNNSGRNAWQNGILLDGLFGISMEDVDATETSAITCRVASAPTGTVTGGSKTITLSLPLSAAIGAGQAVTGTNIPSGDTVASVSGASGNVVTLTTAATGTATGSEPLGFAAVAEAGTAPDCRIAGAGVQLLGPVAGNAIPLTGFSISGFSAAGYLAAAEYGGSVQGTGFSDVNLIGNDDGILAGGAATSDGSATIPVAASLTANSTTMTVGSASGLAVGNAVIGADLPDGEWITAISGTTATLASPATTTASETVNVTSFPEVAQTVTATANSSTATVASVAGITTGMLMDAPNFPAETSVVDISGTTLTLSNRSTLASGTASGTGYFTTSRVLWSPFGTDGIALSGGGCDVQFNCIRAGLDPNSQFGFFDITMSGMNILQRGHDAHAVAAYLSHSAHNTIYDNKVIDGDNTHQQFLVCDTCNYTPNVGVLAYGNSTSAGGDQPQFDLINSQDSSVHDNQVLGGVLGVDTNATNTWGANDVNGATLVGLAGNTNNPSSTPGGALTYPGNAAHNVTHYVLQASGTGPTLTFGQATNNAPMNVLHGVITTLSGEATCETGGAGTISWRFEGHWSAAQTTLGAFVPLRETDGDSNYVHSSVNPNLTIQGAIDTTNRVPVLQIATGGSTANDWSCTADTTAIESN